MFPKASVQSSTSQWEQRAQSEPKDMKSPGNTEFHWKPDMQFVLQFTWAHPQEEKAEQGSPVVETPASQCLLGQVSSL